MARQQEPDLWLNLKPSKWLQSITLGAHLLAMAACSLTALAISLKAAVMIGIAIHAIHALQQAKNTAVTLQHSHAGGWTLGGEAVSVSASSTISPYAVFLHLNGLKNKRYNHKTLLVFYDALTEDDFRQLIVRLKTSFKIQASSNG